MRIVIAKGYERYSGFIASLPSTFGSLQGEVLKDKRNSIVRVEHEGKAFVVKRFRRVSWFQAVIYTFFRPTKASRAYRFAQEFRRRGISTPHEIAYIEQKERGLFRTGYFVSEESHGREAYLDLVDPKEFDRDLASAVAAYIVTMHTKGVLHGDLNSANFLYTRDASGIYSFELIDTNRSRFTTGVPSHSQCMKNLQRFSHRRDLYEYVVRRYAALRGWDEDATAGEALRLLHRFEHRIIK